MLTTTERQCCAGCPVIQKLCRGSHTYLCVIVLNFTHGDFGMVSKHPIVRSHSSDSDYLTINMISNLIAVR